MGGMLRALLRYALDRLGPRYPRFVLAAIFPLSLLVVLGGVWLLDLYVRLEPDRFWRILAVTGSAGAGWVGARPGGAGRRGPRGRGRRRVRRRPGRRVPAPPSRRPVAARSAHAGDDDRGVAGAR